MLNLIHENNSELFHNHEHTLDLLIIKGLNISSTVIQDVAQSDNFCIFFNTLISPPTKLELSLSKKKKKKKKKHT